MNSNVMRGVTFLIFFAACVVCAHPSDAWRRAPHSEKQSNKDQKEREKQAEKERQQNERQQKAEAKEAEKERRRVAAEQPITEYDRFANITKVRSQPITLTNGIFGAPQKTLFGSLPPVTSFQVVAAVLYKGQQTTSANSVALAFNGQSHYHWFKNDRDLVFIVDGNRLNLGRTEYWEGIAATGKTNEFCAIEIPIATFAQIVRGRSVEFRLGSQAFSMYDLTPFQRVLPETATQTTPTVQAEPLSEPLGVTLAGYNKLQIGMSYDEVVRILGVDGVETFRSESGNLQMVSYSWRLERPFGSLLVIFRNGTLSSKSQFGLK